MVKPNHKFFNDQCLILDEFVNIKDFDCFVTRKHLVPSLAKSFLSHIVYTCIIAVSDVTVSSKETRGSGNVVPQKDNESVMDRTHVNPVGFKENWVRMEYFKKYQKATTPIFGTHHEERRIGKLNFDWTDRR